MHELEILKPKRQLIINIDHLQKQVDLTKPKQLKIIIAIL